MDTHKIIYALYTAIKTKLRWQVPREHLVAISIYPPF